jgi:hypothetical protein
MRSAGFLNPRVREVSNQFIAIAIALYLVLPMTIVMNAYVTNCIGINTAVKFTAASCNPTNPGQPYPFARFISSSFSPPVNASALFTTNPLKLDLSNPITGGTSTGALDLNVPETFYSTATTLNFLTYAYSAPGVLMGFAQQISGYLFSGFVMLFLDLLITLAFAAGLGKALNQLSALFSPGSFWGN